jgi:hypothetical protein
VNHLYVSSSPRLAQFLRQVFDKNHNDAIDKSGNYKSVGKIEDLLSYLVMDVPEGWH